jgi:hypothetical protein
MVGNDIPFPTKTQEKAKLVRHHRAPYHRANAVSEKIDKKHHRASCHHANAVSEKIDKNVTAPRATMRTQYQKK